MRNVKLNRRHNKYFAITKYLPIFIILLSISIILGSTFAYFTDKVEKESLLTFSKVELSSETTTGINGVIQDAIPGTKIVDGALKFSKSIDSEAIYVRAKISFSLPDDANEGMDAYVEALRNAEELGIITDEQNGAVWSEKEGNYFYLMEAVNEGFSTKLKKIDTIDTYILTESMVVPYDLEQLPNQAQYMEKINFHVGFQAIQADNVTTDLVELKQLFNQTFPEKENEKVNYSVNINFNNDSAEDILTKVEVGYIIEEPNVSKDGYKLDGWYTKDGSFDGDWGEEVVFPIKVNQNTSIVAKWSEIQVILAVKQSGLGSNAKIIKIGDNLNYNLMKDDAGTIYDTDDYFTSAPVYKDIEIRALKSGTNEVVAILDKDEDESNNNENVLTALQFPWEGSYNYMGDNIEVDIYTYYPTHYLGYIPDESGNFYLVLSDKLISGEIVLGDIILDTDETYIKKIDEYYRSTFEPVIQTSTGYAENGTKHSSAVLYRSVAGQYAAYDYSLSTFRSKLKTIENNININVDYTIDDYHMFDYEFLYLIKYANYDSQAAVGRGLSYKPSKIDDLASYQVADADIQGYGCTPNLANCQVLAGKDGYVGENGYTPVWCLGISNPWGNYFKHQEGLYLVSVLEEGSSSKYIGDMYYIENASQYGADVKSNYQAYYNVYSSTYSFNNRKDIYGTETGQVDNPLLAYLINTKLSNDYNFLNRFDSLRNMLRSGYYDHSGSAGLFCFCGPSYSAATIRLLVNV